MSTYYVAGIPYSSSDIYHHGIKGQKWGVRRYTNPDGTLTEEGKRRYGTIENYNAIQQQKRQRAEDSRWASAQRGSEMLNNPKVVRRKVLMNTALAVGGGLVASGALAGVMKKTGFSDDTTRKFSAHAVSVLTKLGIAGTAVNVARDIHNAKKVERKDKAEAYKNDREKTKANNNSNSGGLRNNNNNSNSGGLRNNNNNTSNPGSTKTGSSKFKTVAKVGLGLAAAGAAVYGAKKLSDVVNKGNENYWRDFQSKEYEKIFNLASKESKANKRKYLLGSISTKQRDAETDRINRAYDYYKKVINQQVDWGRNSGFLNKASNAISYYKSTRKKK